MLTAERNSACASALPAKPETALETAEPNADTRADGAPPDGDNSELTAFCTAGATPRGGYVGAVASVILNCVRSEL